MIGGCGFAPLYFAVIRKRMPEPRVQISAASYHLSDYNRQATKLEIDRGRRRDPINSQNPDFEKLPVFTTRALRFNPLKELRIWPRPDKMTGRQSSILGG
jgi:hypothetical protein